MVEGSGVRMKSKPQKLTMEQYLDFLHSHKQLDLCVDHLNQIIGMHGFKKLLKTHKSVLIETVKTMELMDPARSTLGDGGVSSNAFMSLDDVIKDLKELQWQECCVTSLQTLNAVEHQQHSQNINNESSALTTASASSGKPKRQRKRLKKLSHIVGDNTSTSFDSGDSETASGIVSWVPRRNRGVKPVNENENEENGDGSFGGSAAAASELHTLSSSSSAFLSLGNGSY